MTLQVGLILLYDAGYFQEVVVVEEVEPRSHTVNPAGKVLREQEVTRPVRVRRIRKNVLVKELPARQPVLHPRGSWLEKHAPDEVDTTWKKREPFETRTRSGKVITATPTQAKRIRRLKKNVPERTVTELYAQPGQDVRARRKTWYIDRELRQNRRIGSSCFDLLFPALTFVQFDQFPYRRRILRLLVSLSE
jgi:hypothetical protein